MDRQLKEWKRGVEQIWSASAPDYREAVQLAAEIARGSEEAMLRAAAAQALPSLRNASLRKTDRSAKEAARRRLSLIRDALHALDVPRFGHRRDQSLTPEERYRQLLGLPLVRRLSAPEIHEAYRHAAKAMHPDGGGNAQDFHELSAARDALMKER
jgi:hypothetical protein